MHTAHVRSLFIPISGGSILLPSALVAEIIPYRQPEIPREDPEWLQGILRWRDHEAPLVQWEKILGIAPQPTTEKPRIIICYGLDNTEVLPFYGIIARSMPHSVTLEPDSLTTPKPVKRPGVLAVVNYQDQNSWLPDVEYLEKIITAETL